MTVENTVTVENNATFDDLVTAATVGVARKPLPIADLGDPAAALLDAAALHTVAQRAGYQPERGVTPPAPRAESAPAFSVRAARALRAACDWNAARGFPADNALLPDLLTAAAEAGYVASPPLLPALLDAAVRRTAVRPVVAAVLGGRGYWLAGHRPDWRQVAEAGAPGDLGSYPPDAWRAGSLSQRRAYLTSLRDTDPGAARDLLAAGWTNESGTDRGQLISVLIRGLSLADEEFLEAALDDRHGTVRAGARRLLAQLPGSAFAQRADERAERVLRLDHRGPHAALLATLPGAPEDAIRDGIAGRPPDSSIGTGTWLLTQVIAAAPLGNWTTLLRLSPAEIVALPVAGDLAADVHAGWRLAAVSQGDAEWAQALLDHSRQELGRNRPEAAWPPDQALTALLPPEARAARLAAQVAALPLTTVNPPGWTGMNSPLIGEVSAWPGPWPEILADAVLATLVRAASLTSLPTATRLLVNAAARGLPATGPRDYAGWLNRFADAHPQPWSGTLRSAATTIKYRRVFMDEISRPLGG